MRQFELKSWRTNKVLVNIKIKDEEWELRFILALRKGIREKANLTEAKLIGADLTEADLTRANLTDANLTEADLTEAILPRITPILDLDCKILAALENGGSLDMGTWHGCETTHCRAGWAILLAGEEGKMLEEKYGPLIAGSFIYAVSYPDHPIPDFFTTNEKALADIQKRAKLGERS